MDVVRSGFSEGDYTDRQPLRYPVDRMDRPVFHRTMHILIVLTLALVTFIGSAVAIEPILDVDAVPHLKPDGRESYEGFLSMNLPRAFALAGNGAYGRQGGTGTLEETRIKALKSCADKGGVDCAIYAEDLRAIWPGRAPAPKPPASRLLYGDWEYGLTTDDRYFWHGPQAARGVFVWGHGKGNGYDGRQGQSRGAWNSLQMLSTPGLADAVVAISAASFNSTSGQDAEMSRLLRNARSPNTRVFVAQFRDDIFMPDFAGRIAMCRDVLPSRVGALLTIADPPGIVGHGGGNSLAFARRFGPCMLRFVTAPTPPAGC